MELLVSSQRRPTSGKDGLLWLLHTVLDYCMVAGVRLGYHVSLCSHQQSAFIMMLSMKMLDVRYRRTCPNVVSSWVSNSPRCYFFFLKKENFDRLLELCFLWWWFFNLNFQLEMILPDRAYAFFSHTHKAQKENMPLLDKVSNS